MNKQFFDNGKPITLQFRSTAWIPFIGTEHPEHFCGMCSWSYLKFIRPIYFSTLFTITRLLLVYCFGLYHWLEMSIEQLSETISNKTNILARADEGQIKNAEQIYLKCNAQLRNEITVLKEKLTNLELTAGCKSDLYDNPLFLGSRSSILCDTTFWKIRRIFGITSSHFATNRFCYR